MYVQSSSKECVTSAKLRTWTQCRYGRWVEASIVAQSTSRPVHSELVAKQAVQGVFVAKALRHAGITQYRRIALASPLKQPVSSCNGRHIVFPKDTVKVYVREHKHKQACRSLHSRNKAICTFEHMAVLSESLWLA